MRLGASGCPGTIWGVQGWLRVLPQELATLAVFRLHLGLLPRAGDSKMTVPGQCWGGEAGGGGAVGPGHAQQGPVCPPSESHRKAGLKHS